MFARTSQAQGAYLADAHGAAGASDHDLAWLSMRRAYAFDIGEALAQKRVISADAYLFLYKELVRLCKERAVCWPGLDWLAERLGTSVGTIKRWLEELLAAGLIRRKPRPGGRTTLTIIPALDDYDAGHRATEPEAPDELVGQPTCGPGRSLLPQAPEALFFAPPQRIEGDPTRSPELIPHTIKRQKQNRNVVGCNLRPNVDGPPLATNAVTDALRAAGLTDPLVINELQAEPLHEIQAIIRYVSRQRHIDNPPGLIVALARTKVGTALCTPTHTLLGTQRRRVPAAVPVPAATSPVKKVADQPVSMVADQIEAQLHGQLRERLAPNEWAIWCIDLHLLDITNDNAIMGVPNCLVRDMLARQYLNTLRDAVTAVRGRPTLVELVIEPSG